MDVQRALYDRLKPSKDCAHLWDDHHVLGIYVELKRLAHAKLRGASSHSWNATALVNEAFLRLAAGALYKTELWSDRRKFFAAISETMRHVIIDYYRRKNRIKRGGQFARIELNIDAVADDHASIRIFELDEALSVFSNSYPEFAELVRLRYFFGMSLPESAQALDISMATAERRWRFSRAWLADYLGNDD